MARWIRDEELNQPEDFVQFLMDDYLKKNGFKSKIRKGEAVWQNGDGFLIMARFVRYEYVDGKLHLEAWIGKFRENAIKGFVGVLPKRIFKESLLELIRLLHQDISQTPYREGEAGDVVTVQVADHGNYAVPAIVMSIVGIVASFFSPILGILFGGLGITFGQKARSSAKNNIANAAVLLGTIAIVAALAMIVINSALIVSILRNR